MNLFASALSRAFGGGTLIAGVLLLGSASVQAMPIQGIFTLVDDGDPNVSYADGTFTTKDTSVAGNLDLAGFTDAFGTDYTTVALSFFQSFDTSTLGIGNFSLSDFALGADAILQSGGTGFEVVGLQGVGINGGQNVIRLFGPSDPVRQPIVASASVTLFNGNTFNAESGIQVVSEPGALALFGAGLVGFATVRRRRS